MDKKDIQRQFKVAANICGFAISYEGAELLSEVYELIRESKEDVTLRDITNMQHEVEDRQKKRYNNKHPF